MEIFKKINWSTDINDIVDNVYVKEKRIKESVMYSIMAGTFKEPFGIVKYDVMTRKPPVEAAPKPPKKKGKKKKKNANKSINNQNVQTN